VQRSVYDYFSSVMRRPVPNLNGYSGDTVRSADGTTAVFSIDSIGDRLEAVNYRCSTCVTLVGLCEHLSEMITGRTPSEAMAVTAADLLELHREVPAERRKRAGLAVEAMHSAVRRLLQGGDV
jgi:hypothetical protein